MKKRNLRVSLVSITAVLVFLIAVLAGCSLWVLRSMRAQAARQTAAVSVVERGRKAVGYLSAQPVVQSSERDEEAWGLFAARVRSLYALEDGLQYVSVLKGDEIMFNEQRGKVAGLSDQDDPGTDGITLKRGLISIKGKPVPVVLISQVVQDELGESVNVEVAFRKEAVARQESYSASAIGYMFRVALATVIVSFTICILLVVWMMRQEQEREELRRREEHLAFAGVMANGIVHDFRNPMSSLKLDVQMIRKTLDKDGDIDYGKLKKLSERSRVTVDRMDQVFQEFLFASKPPEGSPEPVDLSRSVAECLSILEPRLEKEAVTVENNLKTSGLTVLAYRASLQRALMNIFVNAEQFAPAGTGKISVDGELSGKRVVLRISDNGPGIPEERRGSVFDMFESTRAEGTGLGLFFARTAIERAGGSIKVVDGELGGACFEIEFNTSEGVDNG